MIDDTICAISTPKGVGAISIIRVSGNDAIRKVNNLFRGKSLLKAKSHTLTYGHILTIDEVLVAVMRAPKTYTKEDMVEIYCHGGILVTNEVLKALLNTGIRLALKGEFSQRAFLNGRIDLVEAESVMDIIEAKTNKELTLANQGKRQAIMLNNLAEDILKIIANIEVNIDYPEYDDAILLTDEVLLPKINNLIQTIQQIIKKSQNGKIIREGIKLAIIGRPNVGKSSLLNALLEEEKAIVTNLPGTTRDIVEGYLNLGGITINLLDTAGLRDTFDIVEKIGVDKTYQAINKADLVLVVFDNSEELTKEDQKILDDTKDKKRIIVLNKGDLNKKNVYPADIIISATKNLYIDELENLIIKRIGLEDFDLENDYYLANIRHINLLTKAYNALLEAKNSALQKQGIDLIEIDLKDAYYAIGDILGTTNKDSITDALFSRFCLGK